MDKSNIMEFCGLFLQKHKHLNALTLQKFIAEREEVGKSISFESISDALSSLYYAGFINIVCESDGFTVYERNTK